MLSWTISFLVLVLMAGVLGSGGVAAISVNIAQTLFVVFLILFVIAAAFSLINGKKPTSLLD